MKFYPKGFLNKDEISAVYIQNKMVEFDKSINRVKVTITLKLLDDTHVLQSESFNDDFNKAYDECLEKIYNMFSDEGE